MQACPSRSNGFDTQEDPTLLARPDLIRLRERVDDKLGELVAPEELPPQELHRAIRYALLAPGKRVRPLLTLIWATGLGAAEDAALVPACAVEMTHAASLVLDDLPCMDNATLRRGKPTSHLVFGEATAVLAAVSLLSRAFGVLATAPLLPSSARSHITNLLSAAIGGSEGAVTGQFLDLAARCGRLGERCLDDLHRRKTGALFGAAAEIGARVAGASPRVLRLARSYGESLGLAFQILDDLLDGTATEASVGKNVKRDPAAVNFARAHGREQASSRARQLLGQALAAAECSGASTRLLTALPNQLIGILTTPM